MPEWIPDKTGHFHIRPRYSASEIEQICGSAIIDIVRKRHGENIRRAIKDDDVVALLESRGADIQLDVEFSSRSAWIQGETEFFPDRPPCIRIARGLPKHRRRSTLPHEGGHELLLREAYKDKANVINWGSSFRLSCADRRAERHDWLEWQADECCGVLLIPSQILEMVIGQADSKQRHSAKSPEGAELIGEISRFFEVSLEFAEVRLWKLGYILRPRRRPNLKFSFDVGGALGGDDSSSSPCQCGLCSSKDMADVEPGQVLPVITPEPEALLPFDSHMPLEA